jgi:uncharacterized protein with GYD domain
MPTYVALVNWTAQGIEQIHESPGRLVAARSAIEAAGGQLVAFYTTLGEYDAVAVVEAPDDAALATILLRIARGGSIRTTTLRAFTEAEYEGIIAALPPADE